MGEDMTSGLKQMQIPNSDPFETLLFSNLLASKGEPSRCGAEIIKEELRIKGQKDIRDLWIEGSDPPRDTPDFLLINIPRNEQGARDEERGFWSLLDPFRGTLEILFRPLIGDAAKGLMKGFIPCLDIKLNAST